MKECQTRQTLSDCAENDVNVKLLFAYGNKKKILMRSRRVFRFLIFTCLFVFGCAISYSIAFIHRSVLYGSKCVAMQMRTRMVCQLLFEGVLPYQIKNLKADELCTFMTETELAVNDYIVNDKQGLGSCYSKWYKKWNVEGILYEVNNAESSKETR